MRARARTLRGRRASALALALVVAVVMVVLAMALTDGASRQSRGSSHLVARLQALHAAEGGVWAAASHLSRADAASTTGDQVALAGDVLRGSVAVQVAAVGGGPLADGDGDGLLDWSRPAVQRAGSFEARLVRLGPDAARVLARGCGGDLTRTVEAWLERAAAASPFGRVAFGEGSVVLDSGGYTDSYDSTRGQRRGGRSGVASSYFDPVAHPAFPVRDPRSGEQLPDPLGGGMLWLRSTTGDPADALGDVASNGPITLRSGAFVYGDARPGPEATVTLGASDHVEGLTTPAAEPLRLAPVTVAAPAQPDNEAAGLPPPGAPLELGGPGRSEFDFTGCGPRARVVLDSLQARSGRLVVLRGGPGQVIDIHLTGQDGLTVAGGAQLLVEPAGQRDGPRVRVFTGAGLSVTSEGALNPRGDPVQLQVWSSAADPALRLTLASTASSQAVLHAPGLAVEFRSTTEFFGAVVGARLTLHSSALLHHDESLRELAPPSDAEGQWVPRAIHEVR